MAFASPQPRYRQVAQTLINEIASGRYAVGDLIPTEFALCEQFGASRFTVREAVKQLVEAGLVSRQAGVGTRVLGTAPRTGYRQVMQGMADLHQYTAETELEIRDTDTITVGAEIAEMLGARVGETWLRLEGIRRVQKRAARPLCFTEIYIHPAFRAVQLETCSSVPIYVRIEQQFGETIAEVQQQIRALSLEPEIARRLGAEPGAPALWISRTYLNNKGEIIEVANSTHPAERFSYSETFRRDRPAGRDGAEE